MRTKEYWPVSCLYGCHYICGGVDRHLLITVVLQMLAVNFFVETSTNVQYVNCTLCL